MRYTISVISEWLHPRAFLRSREIYARRTCACVTNFSREIAPYRININADEIATVPIDGPLLFRDSLHSVPGRRGTEFSRVPYCKNWTTGGIRDTQLHIWESNVIVAIKEPYEDPARRFSRLPAKKRERQRETQRNERKIFPQLLSFRPMRRFSGCCELWRREATGRPIKSSSAAGVFKRDVFEQGIESIFHFLSYFFFLSLTSLFSQHRSSSGTRSSDSSQIVNGTAMFSACQSPPRNLTPRPCIHRPLFLKADWTDWCKKSRFQSHAFDQNSL